MKFKLLVIGVIALLFITSCGSPKPFSRGGHNPIELANPDTEKKANETGNPNPSTPPNTDPTNPTNPTNPEKENPEETNPIEPKPIEPEPHKYTEQEKEDFFNQQVVPALKTSNCNTCHGNLFYTRSSALSKITIGNPDTSKLYLRASGKEKHYTAKVLSSEDAEKIKLWILLEAK